MIRHQPRLFALLLLAVAAYACTGDPGDTTADVADAPDTTGDTDAADGSRDAPGDATDVPTDVPTDGDAVDTGPPPLLDLDQAYASANPFVGSGGFGFAYASGTPAAQMPVGFTKVGPDTTDRGLHAPQNHFSGYHYADPDFRGFSHVRLVGTGAADLGNLRFLPVAEPGDTDPWVRYTRRDPNQETARPGYYGAVLPDEDVTAEMTVSYHSAFHRYAFGGSALLQIDPASSILDEGVVAAEITSDGAAVTGFVTYRGGFAGRGGPFTLHFDVVLDPAPVSVQAWNDEGVFDGASASGTRAGLILAFEDGATVEARVGLSLIDGAAAAANREAELGDASFEEVAATAAEAWRAIFGRVRVAGGTEREQRIFYSALYNAYRMPSRMSEVDGRYPGFDEAVHQADGHEYYSDLSLWDTYRTLHPWYSFTDHTLQRDCLRSLLLMAEQDGGRVPVWPAMVGDTGSMIGTSADIVFGDAAAKGVTGIDWANAFEVLHASTWGRTFEEPVGTGRDGIEDYAAHGYLPADLHGSSVSVSVEYAWDDFGLAAVARAAGLDEQAALFSERSLWFLNLLDPDNGFLMPRDSDGSFVEGISPRAVYMGPGPFTEGSAWHWRFYALHAPSALAEALSDAGFDLGEELEELFAESRLGTAGPVLVTIPDPFYWHGNEPAIHSAALFHEAGRPTRASHWIREIQDRLYGDGPDGLPGNDDGGALSSWFLFTALGLYPVAGSDIYYLNTPVFERAEIDLPDGSTLTVEAPGASSTHRYYTAVTLDGVPVEDGRVRHGDLSNAVLRFTVTDVEP